MKEKFTHWNVLFIEYLKRDFKKILVWILGLGAFSGGYVPAFVEIGKGQGLIALYETMRNPAMIAMVGPTPIKEAADYTLGAMYSHMMLLFCSVFAMIIAGLHIIVHTRKEEENGLTEFVCAYRVGRHANALALFVELLLIHVVLAIFIGGMMTAFGAESVTAAPAFLFGAMIGIAGIMGGAMAFLTAQLFPSATGANGAFLSIVGFLYILRAGTDISNLDWSMFNPMGWLYLTYPFTENNGRLFGFCLLFALVLLCISFLLEGKRDMGDGFLPEKSGRKRSRKSVLSVPGLFLELNKVVILGWICAFLCLGAAYGSIYGDMQTFLEGNDLIRMMFTTEGTSIENSFTSVIMNIMAGLVSILPIVIVNRLFAEETSGHLAQLYATRVSRGNLYRNTLILAAVCGAIGLLASGAGLGGAAIASMKEGSIELVPILESAMNYFPSVFFVTGLAGLFLGWFPKGGKALYIYVGFSMMLNYFNGILNLPEWFEKTAIFSWIPRMPVEEFDGRIFAVMTGIGVILMVIGYLGYQKRDFMER